MIENLAQAPHYSANQVYFFAVIALLGAITSVTSSRRAKSNGKKGLSLLLKICAGILVACGAILIVGQATFG
ncbi:hypothetical protein EDD99_2649 [Streptomyces sp. 846.5]|nr:hypothetical protein [Streptomyces sp. 846.5]TDU04194.1 hypothetical protein EDD99_2649 [Streptomyces sp. 846.5]